MNSNRQSCSGERIKTEDDEQKLREDSEENFPLADFVFEYGGQEIYDWIIGVI